MVKRQKEKQYQSAREHRANSQLRSGSASNNSSSVRKLPFHCCALSLMPFTQPVCTRSNNNVAIVFDQQSIETFLKEHNNLDPVTGEKLTPKELIKLEMSQDDEGRWQCPILTKPFADHTKIVAIVHGNTANVYSYEAYHELNVKAKNYEDLISGEKFSKKKDVLILNDPDDTELQKRRDINTFYHIRHERQLEAKKQQSAGAANNNIRHSVTASRILDKIGKNKSENDKKRSSTETTGTSDLHKEGKRLKIFADDVTGVQLTAGKASGSLTSTVMNITHDNETREATQEEVLQSMLLVLRRLKKKGYVRMETNMGGCFVLEIHCDMVPRTATNFLKLCDAKKYNGSSFHRLIPNFMIQGGKPGKDAKEDSDDSFWGGTFRDEFDDRLKHDAPGILSMANAGAHSNKRQFFLTFAPCPHLDKKHSIFGQVIQGLDLLKELEKISTDKKDRPTKEIIITDTVVIDNPVQEAEEMERKRIQAKQQQKQQKQSTQDTTDNKKDKTGDKKKKPSPAKAARPQIGRYLPNTAVAEDTSAKDGDEDAGGGGMGFVAKKAPSKPKAKPKMKFGNFSGW